MLQDVITMIAEKGCQYTFQEYTELVKLHHRSHPALSPSQLEQRMQKLKEVFFKTPSGEHTPWQTVKMMDWRERERERGGGLCGQNNSTNILHCDSALNVQ